MSGPRVAIGAPVYNHAGLAREAFESILGQTYADFALVIVDDCSTDGTLEIAREYAAVDSRVTCVRNDRRVGMIENFRRAFWAARERCPQAEYFAWASDHDLWHPRWLAALVRELDDHDEAVLAYPLNAKLYPDGRPVDRKPWRFETAGETSVPRRLRVTCWNMSAGNMIYGLHRPVALIRAGVKRFILVPDRLLMAELSVQGQFRQVPEVLWFRRWAPGVFSLSRQRSSFFPNGRPMTAFLPWWMAHSCAFAWNLVVRGSARAAVGRSIALWLALSYSVIAAALHLVQSIRQARVTLLEHQPALRGLRRRVVGGLRGAVEARMIALYDNARSMRRRVRRLADRAIRGPGVALLRGLRAIPIVRNEVIPWLVREEVQEIPAGKTLVPMKRELRSLAASDVPIVVGPWLSEVGFELLYWIPFLNWAVREHGLPRQRLISLSRGGAGCWYRQLCGGAVDVFDLVSIDDYRSRNQERWRAEGNQKQYSATEFDDALIERARMRLNLGPVRVLHPSVMYRLFRYYWYDKGSVSLLKKHTWYRRLPPLDSRPEGLPDDYVAVRFYFRPSFPDTPTNREFVSTVIEALARQTPVVLLNTGFDIDDHEDVSPVDGAGIHRVAHLMTPTRNLELQSRIIAHARAFVGTYGGLSYLGPFHGVPAIGFYSDNAELVPTHLDMSERMCRLLGTPLATVNIGTANILSMVLDGLARQRRRPEVGSSAVRA